MSLAKLIKYSGAGNTIILAEDGVHENKKIEFTKKVCSATNTDGVLFLSPGNSAGVDYSWDFYNADGSSAEMCGNAARCATQFCIEELKLKKEKITFQTKAGKIFCSQISEDQYSVEMPEIQIKNSNLQLPENFAGEKFFFVDTGVPHLVVEKDFLQRISAKDENFKSWAKSLREHKEFQPHGTNVTFVCVQNNVKHAITFERGVEDFTKACGTGAMAAAVYFSEKKSEKLYQINMPGGLLKVELIKGKRPLLIGPSIRIEAFNGQEFFGV